MIRTTPGSGWIGKNCYQNCYRRGAGLAERLPNDQFERAVSEALPAVKVVRLSRVRADLLKGHARLPVPVERLDQESFEQVTVLRRRGAQLHDSDSAGSGGSSRA